MQVNPTSPAVTGDLPRDMKFERWLHRSYFRGSGVHHFISRRLRPAGIALMLVFVLAACLGIGHERIAIYQLFSLCLAMFFIGFPWALLRRARLEAKRELPRYATAGKPLQYTIDVRSTGRFPIKGAWLSESAPDPRPDLMEFTLLREPGEEERNRFDRHFAYFRWQWLLLRKRSFTNGSSEEEVRLKSGEQTRISIELTPLRRGIIRLQDLRVMLPDPFGLFQKCVKVKASPSTLLVLPQRYPLPPIELPGGGTFKISGESTTNAIGNSGEFVGLRDYRPGDPLRQIHWKSWARTGRPIVKELEDTFYPRYGLVLDTLSTTRTDDTFEDAVSVAASFASSLDTSECLLDLMFIKNEAHIITAGRGVERAEKLLEVLAGVSPQREETYNTLAQLVLRHRDDLTSCLVILNGWDEARAEFLRQLTQAGILCAPLVIGSGPAPAGVPGHWLQSGNIARDLERLPARLNTPPDR